MVGLCAALGAAALIYQRDPVVSRTLRAPDLDATVVEPPASDFFVARNRVDVTLDRDITVLEFIQTYQLERTRRDLLTELRVTGDPSRAVLRRGQRITVMLTPPDEDQER